MTPPSSCRVERKIAELERLHGERLAQLEADLQQLAANPKVIVSIDPGARLDDMSAIVPPTSTIPDTCGDPGDLLPQPGRCATCGRTHPKARIGGYCSRDFGDGTVCAGRMVRFDPRPRGGRTVADELALLRAAPGMLPGYAHELRRLVSEVEQLESAPPLDVFMNLLGLEERNKDGNPTDWGDVIRRLQEWKGDISGLVGIVGRPTESPRPGTVVAPPTRPASGSVPTDLLVLIAAQAVDKVLNTNGYRGRIRGGIRLRIAKAVLDSLGLDRHARTDLPNWDEIRLDAPESEELVR